MPETFTRPVLTPAAARARSGQDRTTAPAGDRPVVSLTTDFGDRDPSPAICRGVILGIAPDARLLDVSHEVAKFAILDGALLLWAALPYLPVGVHVAVVDPGVGTSRLPIAIRVARGDVLVGPDNGLLLPAAERLGGALAAHVLENRDYQLPAVSASFHGRDVFSPAGAHLALGVPIEAFGPALDPASLVRLDMPAPQPLGDALATSVIYVDTFGNVKLAGERHDLEAVLGPLAPGDRLRVAPPAREPSLDDDRLGLRLMEPVALTWQLTFGAVPAGDPLLYEDSYGRLCVAVHQGDAATRLGLRAGDRLTIRRDSAA
jgi:S-adenosyl-L-methionine hydrolase (adenosine-forming)